MVDKNNGGRLRSLGLSQYPERVVMIYEGFLKRHKSRQQACVANAFNHDNFTPVLMQEIVPA